MTLREKVQENLNESMKARDAGRTSVLRMLKAAIMKFEVSGDAKKVASDEEVMTIIAKEVKQRKESIEAFNKGGRSDLSANEEAEMKILLVYLPEQMSEAAVREAVTRIAGEVGATSKADLGKLMGAVMKELKGRADGKVVNMVVGELLK